MRKRLKPNKSLDESLGILADTYKIIIDRMRQQHKAERNALRFALEKAIDLIETEYCSHRTPHSKDEPLCYAQDQLSALNYSDTECSEFEVNAEVTR